jgi:hypothetical protein
MKITQQEILRNPVRHGILLIVLLHLLNSSLISQILPGYRLSGAVIDSTSRTKLCGVNIAIESKKTNKILTGTVSDEKGDFFINNIIKDSIKIRLSMIGYSTKTIDTCLTQSSTNLGIISLKPASILLSDVVVRSSLPMIEYNADKMVINIGKVPGNTSSLTDALRNSGVVEVNPSTNKISLRGNSNVKILIDGKPVALAESMLNQLPASSVDKVEITTTSTAKDDPEGEAGIVNIITKKGLPGKYSGSLSVTTSTQKTHFGYGMANYKTGLFNFFSSALYGFGKQEYDIELERINYNSPNYHKLSSLSRSLSDGYLVNSKIGFDLDYDSLNLFTVYGNYFKLKYAQDNISTNDVVNAMNDLSIKYNVKNRDDGNYDNYILSTFYKRKLNNKGSEITLDAFYSYLKNDFNSNVVTTNYYFAGYLFLRNSKKDIVNNTVIVKTDYVLPMGTGKFETGYHFTWRDRESKYDISDNSLINIEWNPHNLFSYKESINAFYAQHASKIYPFEYKAGVRLEHTHTTGKEMANGEISDTDYVSVFPSLTLVYNVSEESQLSCSMARRIQRPMMEFINPFVEWQGPNKLYAGNPKLEPTYTNLVELKYDQLINVFYSGTKGSIQLVETTVNDSISLYSMINTSSIDKYGIEISIPYYNDPKYPFKLPEFITFLQIKFAYHKIDQVGTYVTENLTNTKKYWYILANGSLKMWFETDLTFSWLYTPKLDDGRYITSSTSYLTLVMSKEFFNKYLKVSLTYNNILQSNVYNITTYGTSYYSNLKYNNVLGSGLFLSLNYSFNDFKNREERSIDDGRDKIDNTIFKK